MRAIPIFARVSKVQEKRLRMLQVGIEPFGGGFQIGPKGRETLSNGTPDLQPEPAEIHFSE